MSIPAPIDGAIADPGARRPSHRFRRSQLPRPLLLLALLSGSLLVPAAALAHAELATVSPADKSTVQGSPAEIVMTFVQNLDPAKSSIVVVNPAGSVVAKGGTVPAGKPREMDLALTTPLDPGTYTIRWTTISTEDGETARGTTTFNVDAAASAAPSEVPSAGSSATPSPAAPSVGPTVAPSTAPTTPATSTSDAIIAVVGALIVLAALGLWLMRGRRRAR